MNIFKKLKNFNAIYIYLFLFLGHFSFFRYSNISLKEIDLLISSYLGIFKYIFIINISLDIALSFFDTTLSKKLIRTKLIFFNIFLLALSFLVIFKYTNTYFGLTSSNLIYVSLSHFNLGYIFAHMISLAFKLYDYNLILFVIYFILFISFLFFGLGLILQSLMKISIKNKKIARLEDEGQRLDEKIAIKEALLNSVEDKYLKLNQIQELKIKEQLEKASLIRQNKENEEGGY